MSSIPIPSSPAGQQRTFSSSSPSPLSSLPSNPTTATIPSRRQLYVHSAVFVNPSMAPDHNSDIAGVLAIEEERLEGSTSPKSTVLSPSSSTTSSSTSSNNTSSFAYWLTWTPKYLLDRSDFLDIKTDLALSVSNEGAAKDDTYAVKVSLAEIHTIKRKSGGTLGNTKPHLIFQLRNGLAFPPFHFHDGDLHSFFIALRRIAEISRSIGDYDLFYIHCLSSVGPPGAPSSQSVSQLSSSPSRGPVREDSISSKMQTLIANVSRLTIAARDGLDWLDGMAAGENGQNAEGGAHAVGDQPSVTSLSSLPTNKKTSTDSIEHFTAVGVFELMEDEEIQRIPREPNVASEEWNTFFDEKGRVQNEPELRRRVFYGGLAPDLRQLAWKYFLNYYPFNSTQVEREKIIESKRKEYEVYKGQWKSITTEQESHFAEFVDRKICIEKDVCRTDRTLPFFEGDDNPNLVKLSDILLTYSMFNFDLGYVQGMNDLLSVILIEMDGNEVDSFWCFKGLLDRGLADAFMIKQPTKGIQKQLNLLAELLRQTDSTLFNYLESKSDCLNMIFCFRWLLILFKREFTMEDLKPMWESIWSDFAETKMFQLFFALAILRKIRTQIIQEEMEFDDVLRLTNELAYHLNGIELLVDAELIYRRFFKHGDTELIAKLRTFV